MVKSSIMFMCLEITLLADIVGLKLLDHHFPYFNKIYILLYSLVAS